MRIKEIANVIAITLFFLLGKAYAQMDTYTYTCPLNERTEEWHKIILPNSIFSKLMDNYSDLRIYGVTAGKDTIEAPYILRQAKDKILNKEVLLKRINKTSNKNGYFFTFETPITETINQMELEFVKENFDWRLKLEGSQDQLEWFTVVDDYRILSIENDQTSYQFTTVNFPDVKYRYLGLNIKADSQPGIAKVRILQHLEEQGTSREFDLSTRTINDDKKSKQTTIDLELPNAVPIDEISIRVIQDHDFYRPLRIQYFSDSIHTDKGWRYNYKTLTKGTLSSLSKNAFKFPSKRVDKLRLIVDNHDNQPLDYDDITVKGHVVELIARFSKAAEYGLYYGNKKARRPSYDLGRFETSIPKEVKVLALGQERVINLEQIETVQPLFENKNWLFAIMALVVVCLGWASIRMIRKVEERG